MIQTCKYCGFQQRSCDECRQAVIARTITEKLPNKPYTAMATFLLCTNLDCKEYGKFNREHADFSETFVCGTPSCTQRAAYYDPDMSTQQTFTEE